VACYNGLVITNCLKVARAGRFGTKGLAITFVSDETDAKVLNDVQERFEVNITELPEEIDLATYSKFYTTLSGKFRCLAPGGSQGLIPL